MMPHNVVLFVEVVYIGFTRSVVKQGKEIDVGSGKNWRYTLTVATGCISLFAVLGWVAIANSDAMGKGDVIAERKELMKNTSGNFKDAREKAKAGAYARIAINAQTIAINARHIPGLFPAGSTGSPEDKSRAKAEIWQDWDGFKAASQQLQDAASDLYKLTKEADKMAVTEAQVTEALKAIGGACKNCHDKFRVPKKKK
jgi:cytochrome c556